MVPTRWGVSVKQGLAALWSCYSCVNPVLQNLSKMYSKVGDIFKGISDANQSTYQMEQQKNQHASTQWQTWANGLQDLVRNLETAKQRLQQMDDASNR